MSKIDIDKVKKTFDWDPSKGDYLVRPTEEKNASRIKKFKGIIFIAISVILAFFIISFIKFM